MNDWELWKAEFRGFFWGEGCMQVIPYFKSATIRKQLYKPAMSIALRDDDIGLLRDIQSKLGGHIYYNTKPGGDRKLPMVTWSVISKAELTVVYDILCQGILPAKKRQQLALFGEYLVMIKPPGIRYTPEEKERCHQIMLGLRRLKQYQGGQVVSA